MVAVILKAFEESESLENSALSGLRLEEFRVAWSELDEDGTGYIPTTDLDNLLQKLQVPLGFNGATTLESEELS